MRDAELKREYHRLCRKKPGTLHDTEACFRAFKAGVEYADAIFDPAANAADGVGQQLTNTFMQMLNVEDGD